MNLTNKDAETADMSGVEPGNESNPSNATVLKEEKTQEINTLFNEMIDDGPNGGKRFTTPNVNENKTPESQ